MISDVANAIDGFAHRDWEQPSTTGTVRLAMIGIGWWTREQAIPAVEASSFVLFMGEVVRVRDPLDANCCRGIREHKPSGGVCGSSFHI